MLRVFEAYAKAARVRDRGSPAGTALVIVYFSSRRSKGAVGKHPQEARELVRYLLDPAQAASDAAEKFPKLHHEINCAGGGCLRFSRGRSCGADGEDLLCQVTPESGGVREIIYTHGLDNDADFDDPLRVPAHVTLVHTAGEEVINAHYTFYSFEGDRYRRHGPPKKRTDVFSLASLKVDREVREEVEAYNGEKEFVSLTGAADAHMQSMLGTVVRGGGSGGAGDETEAEADEWLLDVASEALSRPEEGLEVAIMRAPSGAFLVAISDTVADRGMFCTPTGVFHGCAWKWDQMSRWDEPSDVLDALHGDLVKLYSDRDLGLEHRTSKRRRTEVDAPPAPARRGGARGPLFDVAAALALVAFACVTVFWEARS